jgi:hypothetical protein
MGDLSLASPESSHRGSEAHIPKTDSRKRTFAQFKHDSAGDLLFEEMNKMQNGDNSSTVSSFSSSGQPYFDSDEADELLSRPSRPPNYMHLSQLLNEMQNHNAAWPFMQPVNRHEVPDYYDVIDEPMDFSTMENKLERNMYSETDDFLYDAQLIFTNCRIYNTPNGPYTKSANKLEKFMMERLKVSPLFRVRLVFFSLCSYQDANGDFSRQKRDACTTTK